MRKDKWDENEKRLCQEQEILIENHTQTCSICKKSRDEYTKFGISNTPPCKEFLNQLSNHVNNCNICNQAKNRWNEDGIKITPEMRDVVGALSKGQIPDIMKMKKASSQLFQSLEMSSDEIRDISMNADKMVRKSLEKGETN